MLPHCKTYRRILQDVLLGKDKESKLPGKKKLLTGGVTGKLVFVFVDKIKTETEKCWSENEHQPNLRDINTGTPSVVKGDSG